MSGDQCLHWVAPSPGAHQALKRGHDVRHHGLGQHLVAVFLLRGGEYDLTAAAYE